MTKKILAMVLSMTMVVGLMAGCGSSDSSETEAGTGDEELEVTEAAESEETAEGAETASDGESVYRVLYSGEVSTLNYLTSSTTSDQKVGANTVDTLVEYDSDGNMIPSLATDWVYDEDALTWTFTLREGQYWIDSEANIVAEVTAQDFVDAMKYILTPEYTSSVASNLFGVIKNAQEYYNGLTDDYDEIDFSEVGVKALDEYTLEYTLETEIPYFLSMLTYVCFMPAYGPQLEELGASFATSADTMYYCGAYYLSVYEPNVRRVMTKNPYNWDAEHVYIDEIQMTYNAESSTVGPEMAKRGEIDYTSLSADIVDAWLDDPDQASMVSMERPAIDYSYFYCFNFNMHKLDEDYQPIEGEYSVDDEYEPWNWEVAVNNENFRKSIMYAISRISTVAVETGGDTEVAQAYIQNTITPEGFAANEGSDYTDEAAFSDIKSGDFFDTDKAVEYRDAAMAELEGEVTFPVKVLVRYNPDSSDWEYQSTVLEQQLESVLNSGMDDESYIDIIVVAGPSDGFLGATRRAGAYMLQLCNWGADYADPETYTDPFMQDPIYDDAGNLVGFDSGTKYAYLGTAILDGMESADTVQEYFDLVNYAKTITNDTDARYAAFAEAEAYLIDHALAVPYGTSVSEYVVSKLNPWEGQYAAFGVSSLRYKGQHLLDDFFSMDDYNAEAAAHQ